MFVILIRKTSNAWADTATLRDQWMESNQVSQCFSLPVLGQCITIFSSEDSHHFWSEFGLEKFRSSWFLAGLLLSYITLIGVNVIRERSCVLWLEQKCQKFFVSLFFPFFLFVINRICQLKVVLLLLTTTL